MIVKRIETKHKIYNSKGFRFVSAILLFSLQIFCYQFYFGTSSSFLSGFLKKHEIATAYINQIENAELVIFFLMNGTATIAIVWFIYTNLKSCKFSFYFILAGLFIYVATNLLCKATGIVEIGIFSLDVLNFFSTPLITVFLIPALKLNQT